MTTKSDLLRHAKEGKRDCEREIADPSNFVDGGMSVHDVLSTCAKNNLDRYERMIELIEGMPEDEQLPVVDNCHRCRACLNGVIDELTGLPVIMSRMTLCGKCGNKRCPHAIDHRLECTNSNDPGQPGSVY